jgi:isoquinoline 1-oxidoreductase subunit beta
LYANPAFGIQATGGSTSVRVFWTPLREAGASARAMLVQAAAQEWQVEPASCTTANGEVIHTESGRKLSYGALTTAASSETPPKDVPLKDPKDFVLIGKPLKRLDTPGKVDGKTVYGIDAMLPDMKFATLKACPVFGGKVGKVDDSAASKVPGVQKIVVLDDMVAVVGDHMWAAKKGLDALVVDWDEGPNARLSSGDIWQNLRSASEKDGVVAKSEGDIAKGLATGDRFDAAYELPFLAHATMEPLNCTLHVKPDSCEIWTGTQIMARVQSEAAKAAGLPVEKVTVNNHLIGGGFGRRLEPDMVVAAVRIAKQVEGPVKVVWTREEDVQHDIYRPVYRDTIAATLSGGKIVGWKYRVSGAAIIARWLPPAFEKGIDIDAVDSAVDMPYDIPNFHVEFVRAEPPAVPTGFWRGVGPNNNVFAIECFMDELARKAGKDPIAFRRDMLGKTPRLQAALDLVAEKSGWGQPLTARTGRGVCAQPSFGSFIATVVEAEVDQQGEVHLRRVTSAVDTGIAVNPDTIVAQLEGGLIFGLTAALYGEITIDKGRVQQSNFHDYRMLRIDQAPKIEVHVIKSGEPPGGIGETGVTAGPPALRNAIYAATGVALRRLPIDRALIAAEKKT